MLSTKLKMKIKIAKFLQTQTELNRQVLILGAVLFFAGVMAIGTIELAQAGLTGDTNIAQTVSAGSLALTVSNTQLNFNAGGVGDTTTANTGSGAGNAIIVQDTTGSGIGWDLTGYFNTNFVKTGDSNVQMAINQMSWYPGLMTVSNNTGNNADVTAGANGAFAGNGSGNPKTLANSTNAPGLFDIFNLKFNYTIPLTAEATDYTTNLRLTIA